MVSNMSKKRLVSLLFILITFIGLSFPENIEAVSVSNSYMTVRATIPSSRNYAFGSISNDTYYYGEVLVTAEFSIGYQTFTYQGSSSGKGGAYVYVHPTYSNYSAVRARSKGTVTIGSTIRTLTTPWQY